MSPGGGRAHLLQSLGIRGRRIGWTFFLTLTCSGNDIKKPQTVGTFLGRVNSWSLPRDHCPLYYATTVPLYYDDSESTLRAQSWPEFSSTRLDSTLRQHQFRGTLANYSPDARFSGGILDRR